MKILGVVYWETTDLVCGQTTRPVAKPAPDVAKCRQLLKQYAFPAVQTTGVADPRPDQTG